MCNYLEIFGNFKPDDYGSFKDYYGNVYAW